jgi:hypothetical protein
MLSGLALCAACGAGVRGAQTESLEEKLTNATEYVPKAIAPVDQLVEVARKFKIPMGILKSTGTAMGVAMATAPTRSFKSQSSLSLVQT